MSVIRLGRGFLNEDRHLATRSLFSIFLNWKTSIITEG